MIEVRDLTKNYGEVKALRGVSFDIEPGHVVGLLGPNGAGKSTLMRIVTGYLAQTTGSVSLNGVDVLDDPITCQRQIGYLPEGNPLYLEMRLREILRFTADMRGIEKSERPAAIGAAIRDAGLVGREHQLIGSFSRGFRQRVGLAMALLHSPPVLILDEPSSGLDPTQQAEMRRLIRDLGETRTVVFSTHILPEVEATCDRVLLIGNGELVLDGTVDEIREQAATGHSIRVLVRSDADDARATFQALSFATGVEVHPNQPAGGIATVLVHTNGAPEHGQLEEASGAAFKAGLGLVGLDVERPSLEVDFARLTSESWREEHLIEPAANGEAGDAPAPEEEKDEKGETD